MTTDTKNKKLLRKLWKEPVDINKVKTEVIKDWISAHLQKLLPDDDVAVEFIFELLVSAENGRPDIQNIREQLNDFIGKEESDVFCGELWELLVDAQQNPDGLPKKLVEERARKLEEQAEATARREASAILTLIRSQAMDGRKAKGRTWVKGTSQRTGQSTSPRTERKGRVDKRGEEKAKGRIKGKVVEKGLERGVVADKEKGKYERTSERTSERNAKTNYNRS